MRNTAPAKTKAARLLLIALLFYIRILLLPLATGIHHKQLSSATSECLTILCIKMLQ